MSSLVLRRFGTRLGCCEQNYTSHVIWPASDKAYMYHQFGVIVDSLRVKPKFHGSNFLVTSSRRCRATSPFSLPRAYLIGRPAVCCGVNSAARLSVCRVVLQIPRDRHARLVADGTSRQHLRPTRQISSWHVSDTLARTLRGNCSRRISAFRSAAIVSVRWHPQTLL